MNATPAGVDLKASGFESDTRARLGINLALLPVATNRWDATPNEIRKELAMVPRQAEVRLVAGDAPQLYFFRTSEGGTGILEIVLEPAQPDKVRIRYTLLEAVALPSQPVRSTRNSSRLWPNSLYDGRMSASFSGGGHSGGPNMVRRVRVTTGHSQTRSAAVRRFWPD